MVRPKLTFAVKVGHEYTFVEFDADELEQLALQKADIDPEVHDARVDLIRVEFE